MLERER